MNAISKRQPTVTLPPSIPVVVPPRVAGLMHTSWSIGPHPADLQAAAGRWLDTLRPYAEPITEPVLRAWMLPLAAVAVNPPQTQQAGNAWFTATMIAVKGLPIGAFSEATQRELLRRCSHWPSAAEVYTVVREDAARVRLEVEALERIVAAPTRDGERP